MMNEETTTTIIETSSSDGTETVFEIISTKGDHTVDIETDDPGVVEEIIEALTDDHFDDGTHTAQHDAADTGANHEAAADSATHVEGNGLDSIVPADHTSTNDEPVFVG